MVVGDYGCLENRYFQLKGEGVVKQKVYGRPGDIEVFDLGTLDCTVSDLFGVWLVNHGLHDGALVNNIIYLFLYL